MPIEEELLPHSLHVSTERGSTRYDKGTFGSAASHQCVTIDQIAEIARYRPHRVDIPT